GRQFGLTQVQVAGDDGPIDIHRSVVLPPAPDDAAVARWSLGQEFPGRRQCVPAGTGPDEAGSGAVLCDPALGAQAESPGEFTRTIDVPADTPMDGGLTVPARPGDALDGLLHPPSEVRAEGDSDIADPRGNADAAIDGDPATSWHAASSAAHHATSSPTLTLRLPHPRTVTSLRITAPQGGPPAAPTT